MKDYKVDSFIGYSKFTLDSKHMLKDSTDQVQSILDLHRKNSLFLVSTDATNFRAAVSNIL